MKVKNILMLSALVALGSTTFAQSSNLRKALTNIQKYDELRSAGTAQLGASYIALAKEAVDAASIHEKTKDNPETWVYSSLVYANLAAADKKEEDAAKAIESIAKAKELDSEKKNKDNILVAEQLISNYYLNKGAANWEKQDFAGAFESFNNGLKLSPTDTTLLYYSGLAAIQNKDYQGGIAKYKELLDRKDFSSHKIVAIDLPKLYLSLKDTASAIEYAAKAADLYPGDKAASEQNIELNLIAGNTEKIVASIKSQIEKEPTNKSLYYYLGLAESGNDSPANALDAYKKAIEIDPNYVDANLNAGVVLMNQIRDELNALNQKNLTGAAQSAAIKQLKEKLKPVEQYFAKVAELEPNNASALKGLKNYYDFMENEAKSKEISDRISKIQQ